MSIMHGVYAVCNACATPMDNNITEYNKIDQQDLL